MSNTILAFAKMEYVDFAVLEVCCSTCVMCMRPCCAAPGMFQRDLLPVGERCSAGIACLCLSCHGLIALLRKVAGACQSCTSVLEP